MTISLPNSKWWVEKINRSSFFFIALLLHLILFLMVATLVIFQPNILQTPRFQPTYVRSTPPPPPQPPSLPQNPSVPPLAISETPQEIVSPNATPPFTIPPPDPNVDVNAKVPPQIMPSQVAPANANVLKGRLPAIKEFLKHFRTWDNIMTSGDDINNVVAHFPVYLAQHGTDGDWSWGNYKRKEGWTGGALANLIFQIGLWSKGNLKGDVIKSVAIDSPDLLANPPPCIYFTGHEDFQLTDAEIANLQKYLQAGGCVWGDSAFSGAGSRFDVAFHREMKRVLSDKDVNFQPLPMDHDIFTKSKFPISEIPAGMNYRKDPVEIMNLDGKLAVIYTPNDYTDMMTMYLKPGVEPPQADRVGWPQDTVKYPLCTPPDIMGSRLFFYRNYEPESSEYVYKLSTNILAHLLIRFDKDIRQSPP